VGIVSLDSTILTRHLKSACYGSFICVRFEFTGGVYDSCNIVIGLYFNILEANVINVFHLALEKTKCS